MKIIGGEILERPAILICTLVSLFLMASLCSAAEITSCGTVSSSSTLTSDLSINDSHCLKIDANGTVLDCAGHLITGNRAYASSGIRMDGMSGVTIKNCNVRNFFYGITLSSSSYNTLTGNTASGNTAFGIGLFLYSSENTLAGNTAYGNNIGIGLVSASENTLTNNVAYNNSGEGISVSPSSKHNTITNNTAYGNAYGIRLEDSSDHNILTWNNVSHNSDSGISLESASSYNEITCNVITGNAGGYGVGLSNSRENRIEDNSYCDNGNDNIVYEAETSHNNAIGNNFCDVKCASRQEEGTRVLTIFMVLWLVLVIGIFALIRIRGP